MESSWRDRILSEFVPKISRLTIVSDPDALLTEEKLAVTLRTRGFDIIEFNDAIEFRYAYESKYRTVWDQGKHTDLVVVLRLQDSELAYLPFDLLRTGRILSFDLGSLFPDLSYPVIEKLDRSLLDALFDAQQNYSPGRIGDNATKDFILSHIFGIAAELIKSEIELLRTLLRIHYNRFSLSPDLTRRLIQVLEGNHQFDEWALAEIITDEKAFFSFLQERWPVFLSNLSSSDQFGEESKDYGLKYQGPILLPFDHQDIRIYIDNLFVEGKLTPVEVSDIDLDTLTSSPWMKCGISDSGKNRDVRITRLFDLIENAEPTVECLYSDWISFAQKWSELTALMHTDSTTEFKQRFFQLGDAVNQTFMEWLPHHYSGLINLPPTQPVMLHHVARGMSRVLESSQYAGVALIVVDGLSLDQWIPLKQTICEQTANTILHESAVFAWVPTLTSVSRQSVFAGKAPLYFPRSIHTTQKEPDLWRQFWESNGLSRLDISYKRGLGDGDPIVDLESVFNPGRTKAIGLVIDTVDKIMHGMQLGAAGMHNQIRQWSEQGYLPKLINHLLDHHYQIWLTSDHGNIECIGKGRPSEGSIAETKGERVRIYPTPELRSQVRHNHNFTKEWKPIGLPGGYFPLLTEGRDAFIKEGDRTVAHGGVSIEEIIVPLVKIEKKAE